MSTASKPKAPSLATLPKGDYKFIKQASGTYDLVNKDFMMAAFFTETNEFMVANIDSAIDGLGFVINEATKNVRIVSIAVKFDLQERVKYLHRLMDDFGFRIYALFVLGIADDGVFKAFDIYAGVAGQGQFLPLDQVKMFLEQINIAEVERT